MVYLNGDIHDIIKSIKTNSIDLIYASHVFEYFDKVEAPKVLQTWYQYLKPGGILRLAVPDFDALISMYNEKNDLDLILGPLYGRWQFSNGNATTAYVYHKTAYNFRSLKEILNLVGFSNVKRWSWQDVFTGELVGFDDHSQAYFPKMDKEHGMLLSLNVEGVK